MKSTYIKYFATVILPIAIMGVSTVSGAWTITKSRSNTIVIVGTLGGNGMDIYLSNDPSTPVSFSDNNLQTSIPVLQAGDANVSMAFIDHGSYKGIAGIVSVIGSYSGPNVVTQMAYNIDPGLVSPVINNGQSYLVAGPDQAGMLASSLTTGKQVSISTYTVDMPIFDKNGNYVAHIEAGTLADSVQLLN